LVLNHSTTDLVAVPGKADSSTLPKAAIVDSHILNVVLTTSSYSSLIRHVIILKAIQNWGSKMKLMAISAKLNARKMVVRSIKLLFMLLLAGMLANAYTNMANAQMISPFGGYRGPTLTKDDYKLAREAVEKLLNETAPPIGRYDTWSNSASGNHGKFTILSIFTSNGLPCRKVNSYVVYRKAGSAPRSFTLDVCKLPGGEWKTVA
jgi:surface antigen